MKSLKEVRDRLNEVMEWVETVDARTFHLLEDLSGQTNQVYQRMEHLEG